MSNHRICPTTGKRGMTEPYARRALARMKRSVEDPEHLNTYPCLDCGLYHIGNIWKPSPEQTLDAKIQAALGLRRSA